MVPCAERTGVLAVFRVDGPHEACGSSSRNVSHNHAVWKAESDLQLNRRYTKPVRRCLIEFRRSEFIDGVLFITCFSHGAITQAFPRVQ